MRSKRLLPMLMTLGLFTSQLGLGQSSQLKPQVQRGGPTRERPARTNQPPASPKQDLRDDPETCLITPGATAPGRATASAQSCPTSPFTPPEANDTTFVADCGAGLDTGCTFRAGGPLIFNVKITRFVGDKQKLKDNGLLSPMATLQMPAFDVDFFGGGGSFNPERDRVTINGNVVPGQFLQGDNNVWRLNEFSVPIEWVNFAQEGAGGGAPTPGDNIVRIDIDTANSSQVWCTSIDWAAITFDAARPVVMVHGILSNGGAWDKSEFSWVDRLNSLGIPNSNNLNMGNLDSIQNNAAKVAQEVANAKQRWGVEKVNLVCHSKGGLDSRHFVENNDSVERVIQLGTPNAGSPLADVVQAGSVVGLGILPTILINSLAGPAGVQLTRPYMGVYNATHGSNPQVRYTSLAGDYNPDCFFLNPFCRPVERLLLAITGRGDTIVPVSSVHALGYAEHLTFGSSGGNKQATHTSLNGSSGVYNRVRGRVEVFGQSAAAAPLVEPAVLSRTATQVGSIQQGQVQVKTIPVDQSVPIFFTLMYPSGNLDLALISPSGQRFDAATVVGNPNVARDEAEVPGGMLEVYSFGAPEVGLWTVEISAPAVTEPAGAATYAVGGWLENAAITFGALAAPQSIHSGEPLRLVGTLRNNGAPLTGASVNAKLALPDDTTRNVTMLDDGANGDAAANDGIYTGQLNDTAQPGTYRIAFQAQRAAAPGAPAFSREDFSLATVSRSNSTISGPFADFGRDTDGDGLFNQLVVNVGVNATVAGSYRLSATLEDAQGRTHPASMLANLNVGANTVGLAFDGESLFNNRVDGPYRLKSVTLAEEGTLDVLPVDQLTDAHQTAAYNFRQFQHDPIALTGNGSTTGIDNNGNGLFDLLRVAIEVEVISSGFYNWSGRLTDGQGRELGFSSGSGFFNAGTNNLILTYAGLPIGSNGVDGPYFVRGLLVFGAGDSLVASDAFTTGALRASQFEGFTGGVDLALAHAAAPDPVLTGANITYTSVVTNNGSAAAQNVLLTNNLPAGTSFVSCSTTSGACGGSGNNRTVSIPTLAAGGAATVVIVANVDCPLAAGTVISDTASVSASTADTDPSNNTRTASVVAANPAPVLAGVKVDRPELWPPNHEMQTVTVHYTVADNCGTPDVALSVTSNEPVDGTGDGDTAPDWEIVDAHHVRLRAERSGNGGGRVYTILITATDSAGGVSTATVAVRVPLSRKR